MQLVYFYEYTPPLPLIFLETDTTGLYNIDNYERN